jgi:ribokinase
VISFFIMADRIPLITVVGSLNMDMVTVTSRVPSGGETIMAKSFSTGCGGKGANQAIAAARLSSVSNGLSVTKVEMIGAVGSDGFGEELRNNLKLSHIDTSKIKICKDIASGTATILVEEETGENRILVAAGANGELEVPPYDFVSGDLILAQLECPAETIFKYLKYSHRTHTNRENQKVIRSAAHVILNPSPAAQISEEVLQTVDYLVVNESEAAFISGVPLKGPFGNDDQLHKAADALIEKGAYAVIITLGGEGVFYKLKNSFGSNRFRAKPVKVVDSTGAGDTFVGAFAVRMVRSPHPLDIGIQDQFLIVGALEEAIRFGMDAAALAIQKRGAQDSIPSLEDLPEWAAASLEWKHVK